MSGKVVGWAFAQEAGSPAAKLILVKLADNANDEGFCFPSQANLRRQTELSERAVRKHLVELVRRGLLVIQKRFQDGVQLPHHYYLQIPESAGVGHEVQGGGARGAPGVGHEVPPEPSIRNRQDNPQKEAGAENGFPSWFPKEAWEGFIEMRRRKGAPPTARAIELLVQKLTAFRQQGHDPAAILEASTMNNWTGIFEPRNGGLNGARSGPGPIDPELARVQALEEAAHRRLMEEGSDSRPQ